MTSPLATANRYEGHPTVCIGPISHGPFGPNDLIIACKPYPYNPGFMIVMHKRYGYSPAPGLQPYCTHVLDVTANPPVFMYGNYFDDYEPALIDFNRRGPVTTEQKSEE